MMRTGVHHARAGRRPMTMSVSGATSGTAIGMTHFLSGTMVLRVTALLGMLSAITIAAITMPVTPTTLALSTLALSTLALSTLAMMPGVTVALCSRSVSPIVSLVRTP